ncbi:MAG TPA: LysR substrate-binding domain-containing protein [Nostoc sp.]|uniref:LysR substrate-binding domain-containing protein n=1 Tax=Nostoc sp. TaxID=1180 RepID=UPI002D6199B8|nr:LysR substrate-binding domain-containing protein [Nostoc sp.]HYX15094.1 LysR substrate-binding domain-containing protein [Nostoc sp.]
MSLSNRWNYGTCATLSPWPKNCTLDGRRVAAEMGVAIVPASLQNLQRIGVIYKTLEEPTPKVAIAMIWRKNETSPTVLKLVEIVKQAAQQW